ncbi:MAG: hypothetical protein ACRDTQ_14865 [Micromonosporaceae bacterium]
MKIGCHCGGHYSDNPVPNPWKAFVVADEDRRNMAEDFDQDAADSGSRHGVDEFLDILDSWCSDLFQCWDCGRLIFDGADGKLHYFRPDNPGVPSPLLVASPGSGPGPRRRSREKVGCDCGSAVDGSPTLSPCAATVVPDEGLSDLLDEVDEDADGEAPWRDFGEFMDTVGRFSAELFQCSNCGRLVFHREGDELHRFTPDDPQTPTRLLRSRTHPPDGPRP